MEFIAWWSMLQRCSDPTSTSFARYGARGVTVCARWRESFENFLADMGRRPSPKHSIDRIDSTGNYEPGNCRWSTVREQAWNRKTTLFITVGEETLPAVEWSRRLGGGDSAVLNRINRGWDPVRAATTPLDNRSRVLIAKRALRAPGVRGDSTQNESGDCGSDHVDTIAPSVPSREVCR